MKLGFKKSIHYLISFLFLGNFQSSLGNCLNNNCFEKNSEYKLALNQNSIKSLKINKKNSYEELLKIFAKDKIFLNLIFASLINEDNDSKTEGFKNLQVDILSEIQYQIQNTFYAENDVEVIFSNGILKADKISYDRENSIFKAEGNITFYQGDQYFTSDYLEYNFENKKGYIDNIYGVLNFLSLGDDLNYEDLEIKNNIQPRKINIIDSPSEIQLLNSNNLRFRNKLGFNSLNYNFSSITKWRFKSKRILLGLNSFQSDLILFTNDPFNKPQLILKSKDIKGEVINGKFKFFSKKSFLVLDDTITIPLGSRTIQDSDVNSSWSFGYDEKKLDGFYINRNPESTISNDYLNFKLKPYFLIQRAIKGSSDTFREKGSSLSSKDINLKTNIFDYFALEGQVNSNLSNWNLNLNSYLRSLNLNRLHDSFLLDAYLVRNIFSWENHKNNEDKSRSIGINNKNKNSKINTDLAFYGLIDKDDIYSGYGFKIINNYFSNNEYLKKKYSLLFDFGEFSAKSLNNNNSLKLKRYGFISSLSHKYKIFDLNPKDYEFSSENTFMPNLIDQAIFLKAKIASGFYSYENNTYQNNISFHFGPVFTYGEYKKRFLDYSSISIIEEITIKNSQSPFEFDNFNEDSRINFDVKQQLYGPILIGYQSYLNINDKSSNYGKFENITYTLGLKRRSYSSEFVYRPNDKALIFRFSIFNFGYKDISSTF